MNKETDYIDLEKQVLAEILLLGNWKEQFDALGMLQPHHFNSKWRFYFLIFVETLLKTKSTIDLVSLYQLNKDVKGFNSSDLALLSQDVATTASLFKHIALLIERHYKHETINDLTNEFANLKDAKTADDVDEVKNSIIVKLSSRELVTQSQFIDFNKNTVKLDEQLKTNKGLEGYSWGLVDLDALTGGITKPYLYVVGGLKKGGKTRFIWHCRKQLYDKGIPSPFLSLEVPEYKNTIMLYSALLEIPEYRFKSWKFLNKDGGKEKYQEGKRSIDFNLLPTECITGLNESQVLTRIRRYAKLFPGAPIFIDYLQRMKHDKRSQASELEQISNNIADAARENDTPIILLSQLNTNSENEVPNIGHLKGSGGIGEAADVIILVDNHYRRTKKEADKESGRIDLIVEQRYGEPGTVKTTADLSICKFKDIAEEQIQGIEPPLDYNKNKFGVS